MPENHEPFGRPNSRGRRLCYLVNAEVLDALAVGVGQEKVRTFVDGLESQSAAALGIGDW